MSRPRRTPPVPEGLSEASAALWPGLVADVGVMAGDAEVDLLQLEELLRTMDRLAQARAAIDRDGITVTGSKGQTRAHPLLPVEDLLRRRVAEGIVRLRLGPSSRDRYDHRVRDGRIEEVP